MTKTIEFVERKIKDKKDQLKRLKNLKTISNKYELKINELLTKNAEEDIEHLEQIKCELEAWEICKNKLNLKVQTEEAVTEGFCMKGYWLLVEQYPYTQTTIIEQEEYKILKKALEVEEYE